MTNEEIERVAEGATQSLRWDCQIALGKTKTRRTEAERRGARKRVAIAVLAEEDEATETIETATSSRRPRESRDGRGADVADATRATEQIRQMIRATIESAVDAALGEVARQQNGIAGQIRLEARGCGISEVSHLISRIGDQILACCTDSGARVGSTRRRPRRLE